MDTKYALVTGATAGIGLDIAKELASQGKNIILTARREDRLCLLYTSDAADE